MRRALIRPPAAVPARLRTVLPLTALFVASSACAPEPPDSPERTALRMFDLTGPAAEPGDEALTELFGAHDGLTERAELLDALAGLGSGRPHVVAVEEMRAFGATAVDLALPLDGGGEAEISVQVERSAEGTFRVRAFHGPGVSWPPRRSPGDRGLSTSAAPPDDAG